MSIVKGFTAIAVVIASASLLVACGSDGSGLAGNSGDGTTNSNSATTSAPASTTPTTTTPATTTPATTTPKKPIGGGSVQCSEADLGRTVVEIGQNRGTPSRLIKGGFRCSGGWAVAQVLVGTGSKAQQETWVFQAEGPFWIPQDRAKVCADPPQVPATLQNEACNTN